MRRRRVGTHRGSDLDILALPRGAGISNVTRIRHALPLPADVVSAINNLDAVVIKAIDEAKAARLAQGLKVAIIHGDAHAETHRMVTRLRYFCASTCQESIACEVGAVDINSSVGTKP